MKHNDIDLKDWKNANVNVDSLWIIPSRDKGGKHKNAYHGNFIPQIPNQLIRRYTKENEVVLDVFLGSGTTLYECESLKRKCVGMDINTEILQFVKTQMGGIESMQNQYFFGECDNRNSTTVREFMQKSLDCVNAKSVQFIIMHPPYMDIIKFSEKKEDLSLIGDLKEFITAFLQTCQNIMQYLDSKRYFAIVLGDVYKQSEVKPLAFYTMNAIKQNFNVKLKGIVVKNIEGNRGKLGSANIWQYRALSSDYYLFKHEYIFVFKKEG